MYRSGFISIFSIFCIHHCCLISVCFHYSKEGPCLSLRLPPFPSSWQPPVYFLSLWLCLLWTSQMPGINQYLLHLAYFTWRNISKVFPACSACQHFMLLYDKQIGQFESVILNNYNFKSMILSICYFELLANSMKYDLFFLARHFIIFLFLNAQYSMYTTWIHMWGRYLIFFLNMFKIFEMTSLYIAWNMESPILFYLSRQVEASLTFIDICVWEK